MRLMIAGWQGQLAQALVDRAVARSDVTAYAVGRPALDLLEPPTVHRNLADVAPDVVINAAAYTAVDKAETEERAAYALNCEGARLLAEAAANRGVPIIHISTDYVYPGTKSGPYLESDPTGPNNVYGRTKLAGEEAVSAANPQHVILRTAWVFSAGGANFVRTMLRLASERDEVRVVDDQHGSPTYAPHLANATLDIARQLATGSHGHGEGFGVFNAAGAGHTTWCEFARAVFERSRARGGPHAEVTPITTADYPTPAARPANSVLDCAKLRATWNVALPPWEQGLDACMDELHGQPG